MVRSSRARSGRTAAASDAIVATQKDTEWGNYFSDVTTTMDTADISTVDSLMANFDANIENLTDNKSYTKELEKLTALRSAMARRRQILSDAGTGRSQYQFNTSLNKNNLFNSGNNSLLG